jgi:protein-tyrosine phosphatase
MNLFGKKNKGSLIPDYASLRADMHSHLIPGIDDGAPDMPAALNLVKGMMELGFSKLVTTPHVLWDIYKNSSEIIRSRFGELQEAVAAAGLHVELGVAAEYFLDDHVTGLLERKEPLLSFGEKFVLVEVSMAYPSHGLKQFLFEMQMQGYQPVIAHPERYIYLHRQKEFYDELKTIGCLFQLNMLSLAGHYGKSVQEAAAYIIKKGYYDFAGTDLHHARHLEALQQHVLVNPLKKLLDSGKLRNPAL